MQTNQVEGSRLFTQSISIVIVNWNGGDHVISAVKSILDYSQEYLSTLVVVDNGSTDGSLNALEDVVGITLIRAGENLGFGRACNLGAKLCHSKYVLFLNPDARLFSDTLGRVISFMELSSNASVGICGVQLIGEAGDVSRSSARFPSCSSVFMSSTGLDRFFPKYGHFMREWDHLVTRNVDQVMGAFFFVRKEVFDTLQGFDQRFFVYYEEVDFSYRARLSGYSTTYLADAQAFHEGGGTSKRVKDLRLFYLLRSRLLFAQKHFSTFDFAVTLILTLMLEPISRSIFCLAKFNKNDLKNTLSAYARLYQELFAILAAEVHR